VVSRSLIKENKEIRLHQQLRLIRNIIAIYYVIATVKNYFYLRNIMEFEKYHGACKLIGPLGMERNLINILSYMVVIKMKLRRILKIGSMYHY